MRLPHLVAAVMAFAMLAGTAAESAFGHYYRLNYARNASCEDYKDPVTVVFQGRGASNGRVIQDTILHTGWKSRDPDEFLGKPVYQSYRMPGHGLDCRRQGGTQANHKGPRDRDHIRFFPLPDRAHNELLYVFGTPHREQFIAGHGCGRIGTHAVEPGHVDPENQGDLYYKGGYVSGFDAGRGELIARYSQTNKYVNRHRLNIHKWTNTRSFKQCNGWQAGSSGQTWSITVGYHNPEAGPA